MKNEKRKLISGVLVLVLLLAMATTFVFAHDGDNWEHWVSNFLGFRASHSHFYCPAQRHHATAGIFDLNHLEHISKVYADEGKWAKADTNVYFMGYGATAYYGHD